MRATTEKGDKMQLGRPHRKNAVVFAENARGRRRHRVECDHDGGVTVRSK